MRVEEVLDAIQQKCMEHGAEKIILFGSRAKGTAMERSDIDIAVSGVEDMDELEEALWTIPTLYKIDLVDLDHCRNDLLMEDIVQYGRKIWEKI